MRAVIMSSIYLATWMVATLLPTTSVTGQTPSNSDHDVVLLKNGGVARGRILAVVCGEHVLLEVSGGETTEIAYDDVLLITDNRHYAELEQTLRCGYSGESDRKWQSVTQATTLVGERSTHLGGFLAYGRRVDESLLLGMGVGWENLDSDLISASLHAWFFHNLTPLSERATELYLHLSAGYGHNIADRQRSPEEGGVRLTLGMGAAIGALSPLTTTFEVGYHYQSLQPQATSIVSEDFLSVGLGLRF